MRRVNPVNDLSNTCSKFDSETRDNHACPSHDTSHSFLVITLSKEDIDYLIEILKTLYNLTVDLPNLTQSYANQEEEEEGHLMRLVSILRDLILCDGPTDEKRLELQR
jgi:hypothetical protein